MTRSDNIHGRPGTHGPPGTAGNGSGAGGADTGGDTTRRAVYVISVAAELAGVHPQTLRLYERRGLLDPRRTGGGNRRYSDHDLQRLRHIQDLTTAGVSLEGVRRVLELEAELERLRAELEEVRAEAVAAVERTHRHYRRDLVPLRQALVWRAGGRNRPGGPSQSSPRR